MKMFRRISALALAVVMICLLSASAFAASLYDYDYRDSHSFDDEYNTEVAVFARIDQHSTDGFVEFLTNDLVINEISIVHSYRYYPLSEPGNILTRNDGEMETNVTSHSLSVTIASVFQMKDAEYSFNVTCSTSYGEDYCSFDSGLIAYP